MNNILKLVFILLSILILTACDDDNEKSNYQDKPTNNYKYTLLAWNDLGMHCMDGKDFSIFSILPPYNNLHTQLKDKNGRLITNGVTLTYEAIKDKDGKINTSSSDKINFWQYSSKLFPNSNLSTDTGLMGNKVPSTTPNELKFNSTNRWWEAEGIPLTPYNNDGSKNYYPLVKVTAKDNKGNILVTSRVVLPVSDEMDCKRCHSSSAPTNSAKPTAGWVNNSNPEKDFKYNILRKHDEKYPNATRDHIDSLKAKGYDYNMSGLEVTAKSGTPIFCAACHSSNALPGSGVDKIKTLTQAIHGLHAKVTDPYTNLSMDSSKNRNACYACHPGTNTKYLRGAMGDLKDNSGANTIQCQNCHGNLSAVGKSNRKGWLDEPNCQACHHDGKVETSAVTANGTLKSWADKTFATNSNTPTKGLSLYRFSTGHGKLQCEACHGSPHAIYPAHNGDNLLSKDVQGYSGLIGECIACHKSVPNTSSGGPHGMHTIGQNWVNNHKHYTKDGKNSSCTKCHGKDYRGSRLSKTWRDRTFKIEHKTKLFQKGHQVSCYDCHNGPSSEDDD